MILSVTLNPCVDHTIFVNGLTPHDRNRILRTETDAGGKGVNLSRIVAELGGDTTATGFLGGDTGCYVCQVLDRQGVHNDFVKIALETRTNMSVESGDGPPTVFGAPGPEITGLDWENLIAKVATLSKKARWVALGGSLPPGLPIETYKILGELARSCGAKWVLDADGEALREGLKAGPDFIKPNHEEAGRLLGRDLADDAEAAFAAQELRERLIGLGSLDPLVVVSMGAQGAAMACDEGKFIGEPIQVDAKSTIGSGDSLIGGTLWARSQGLSWPDALRWGMSSGAATAMTDGNEIGRKPVIESLHARAVVRPA